MIESAILVKFLAGIAFFTFTWWFLWRKKGKSIEAERKAERTIENQAEQDEFDKRQKKVKNV